MLLSNLIDEQYLTPSVSKLDIYDGSRNGGEEEHIGKDEHDVIDIIGHVVLDHQDLVVRIGVVCRCHVNHEDHTSQITIICLIGVHVLRKIRIFVTWIKAKRLIAQNRISHYHRCEEYQIHQNILIC